MLRQAKRCALTLRLLVCLICVSILFVPLDRFADRPTSANASAKTQAKTEFQRHMSLVGPVYPFYYADRGYLIRPEQTNENTRVVLLSFDDGPFSKKTTLKILDVLERQHVKALFFVNGYLIQQSPKLLQEIYLRGHEIGNHTYSHARLTKVNPEQVESEIAIVQRQVQKYVGVTPRFFRPPYGEYDERVKQVLVDKQLQMLNWSDDAEDWKTRKRASRAVLNRVMTQLRPGSIILLHDVPGTAALLDELIYGIKKRGYTFIQPRQLVNE